MPESTEREELEQLVAIGGWQRLLRHAHDEWEDGYAERLERVLLDTKSSPEMAREHARQVAIVREAIRTLLQWPEKRVKDLIRQDVQRVPRRDPQSRRGGL